VPLDTQNGSVADRLRNFFKLTGRVPAPLDDVVVPVANLVDLDGPPWRTADENWSTSALTQPALAANVSYAGVWMPRGMKGVAVVKQVVLENEDAAAQTFFIAFVRITPTDQNQVLNVEHFGDSAAGLNPRVPLRGGIFTNGALIGEPLVRATLQAGASLVVPVSYALRGVNVKLNVIWDWQAPAGADTHFAFYRGTRAKIEIRQTRADTYRPELYVIPADTATKPAVLAAVRAKLQSLQKEYPGVAVEDRGAELHVTIPDAFRVGHEAHFAQVATRFLSYLRDRSTLPTWERPNMLAKYFVTTTSTELSRRSPPRVAPRIAPQ